MIYLLCRRNGGDEGLKTFVVQYHVVQVPSPVQYEINIMYIHSKQCISVVFDFKILENIIIIRK